MHLDADLAQPTSGTCSNDCMEAVKTLADESSAEEAVGTPSTCLDESLPVPQTSDFQAPEENLEQQVDIAQSDADIEAVEISDLKAPEANVEEETSAPQTSDPYASEEPQEQETTGVPETSETYASEGPQEDEVSDADSDEEADATQDIWSRLCESLALLVPEGCDLQDCPLRELLASKKSCPAPCALLDIRTNAISSGTQGFEDLLNKAWGASKPAKYKYLSEILRSDNLIWDEVINLDCWAELNKFREDVRRHEPDTEFFIGLMLGRCADGEGFWNLVYAVDIAVRPFGTQILVIVTPLRLSIELLTKLTMNGKMIADVSVVKTLLKNLRQVVRAKFAVKKAESLLRIPEIGEEFCKQLADNLISAFEGDHFVPNVGSHAVKTFEKLRDWENVLGNVEKDLTKAWEINDKAYRDSAKASAKTIACAVANPSAPDCPLVYISSGFELLTKYPRSFALGRNCRFLQPNSRPKNAAFNGIEIKRMKEFCQNRSSGQVINLLLNEASDKAHFWNLLFMNHIRCQSVSESNLRPYIFGLQTNIVIQKHLLDSFILDVWEDGAGPRHLCRLRELFQKEERDYEPKKTSLKKIVDDVVTEWAHEIGRETSSFWEGAQYSPVLGLPQADEFKGQWPFLLEMIAQEIQTLFEMDQESFQTLQANTAENSLVCMVSDPSGMDCPVVFVSKSFEVQTGYSSEYALGRNGRFLQTLSGKLNMKVNENEILRIQEFMADNNGVRMASVLLNQNKMGDLFWDLIHIQRVNLNGRLYILEIHSILDTFVPLALRRHSTSQAAHASDQMLPVFIDALNVFLDQLRFQLRGQAIERMSKEATYVSESIMSFMKRNCDDFEGDHLVPKVGDEAVQSFELDMIWKRVLCKINHLLVNIWEVSEYSDEEVACAVSDPNSADCPLVYVSKKFEQMTGYPREWVLGRNCRFLQPNDFRRNLNFNEEDKLRMREFCSGPKTEGTRIINLLINESKTGYPFWNLLVMEHVFVEEKDFIFAVQTKIDIETARLAEILAMDRDGIVELTRLRQLLRNSENGLQRCSLKTIANDMIREWVSTFPPHLELPRFQISGDPDPVFLPLAGLVLSPNQPLHEIIWAGFEEGVRHFTLALDSDHLEDEVYCEKVGRLLSLRIAEVLNNMRLKYFHYLLQATVFSLITRPQFVDAFKGLSKALHSCGYAFRCWFLDVRAINPDKPLSKGTIDKICQCWQSMSAAQRIGDVKALGLLGSMGSIIQAMQCLKRLRNESPVAVLAVDDHPGKDHDHSKIDKFRRLYAEDYGSPPMLTYNLHGQNESLHKSEALQEVAEGFKTDITTLLLKWAEAQGYGVLLSKIKDKDLDISDRGHALPKFHRGVTRTYADTAAATECGDSVNEALSMEGLVRKGRRLSTGGIQFDTDLLKRKPGRQLSTGNVPVNTEPVAVRRVSRRQSTSGKNTINLIPLATPRESLSGMCADGALPARRHSISKSYNGAGQNDTSEAISTIRSSQEDVATGGERGKSDAASGARRGSRLSVPGTSSGSRKPSKGGAATAASTCSACNGRGFDEVGLPCLVCAKQQRDIKVCSACQNRGIDNYGLTCLACAKKQHDHKAPVQDLQPPQVATERVEPALPEPLPKHHATMYNLSSSAFSGPEFDESPQNSLGESPHSKRKLSKRSSINQASCSVCRDTGEEKGGLPCMACSAGRKPRQAPPTPQTPSAPREQRLNPVRPRRSSWGGSSTERSESTQRMRSPVPPAPREKSPAPRPDPSSPNKGATGSRRPSKAGTSTRGSTSSDGLDQVMATDKKLIRQVERLRRMGLTMEDAAQFLECNVNAIAPIWDAILDDDSPRMCGG